MSKAIIVLGMQFGDESKGSCVDYLCDLLKPSFVVKFNGGHQCAHHVVLDDGTTHCFSQFGSGTFSKVPTYLGPNFIVELMAMEKEASHLIECGVKNPFGLMYISPKCLITTPFHKILNHIQEISRGDNNHGSCGVGIGETREYWLKYGGDSLKFEDLADKALCLDKLELMRQRMILKVQEYNLSMDCNHLMAYLYNFNCVVFYNEIYRIYQKIDKNPYFLKPDDLYIFEGSQGVLLDENFGFHPHTTWSTTTDKHARELISEFNIDEVETIGVLRSYMTRHGAGPFPSECKDTLASNELNSIGKFTGGMRYGYLDNELVKYSLQVQPVDSLFVTHVDEDPNKVCYGYKDNTRLVSFTMENFCLVPSYSLKTQEYITRKLFHKIPKSIINQSALSMLNSLVPVKYVSNGPKRSDKALYAK